MLGERLNKYIEISNTCMYDEVNIQDSEAIELISINYEGHKRI